jgi:MFS family permease
MNPVQSSADQQQAVLERSALFVATLTSFMGPFMLSSVNVALPAIQADLGLNAVQLSWVATSYLLAMATGLLPAGKIADMYGRKKIFSAGLLVYTLGATSAAFAGTAASLIIFRVMQGLGAAMFVTTGMAILTSIFPPQKRGTGDRHLCGRRVYRAVRRAIYRRIFDPAFWLAQHLFADVAPWSWLLCYYAALPQGRVVRCPPAAF